MTPTGHGTPGRAGGPDGAVLFPGAGSSRDHHTLVALESALAPRPVVRADFPYRRAGRKAPDREPVLVEAVRVEAGGLAGRLGVGGDRLLLGGRSMGGRMASLAVAGGLPAWGLLLVSYPLHPPGRPDRLRTAHFPRLEVPVLFVSGTRDAFATVDELETEAAAIRGPVTVAWVEGGRHPLDRVDDRIVAALGAWLAQVAGAGR